MLITNILIRNTIKFLINNKAEKKKKKNGLESEIIGVNR